MTKYYSKDAQQHQLDGPKSSSSVEVKFQAGTLERTPSLSSTKIRGGSLSGRIIVNPSEEGEEATATGVQREENSDGEGRDLESSVPSKKFL